MFMAKLSVRGTGAEARGSTGLWKMTPGGYRGTVEPETQLYTMWPGFPTVWPGPSSWP